ncbi:MAG: polysaccharide deacetylase family protein [Patescibacteria group bacterium]
MKDYFMKRRRSKKDIRIAFVALGAGFVVLIGLIYFHPVTSKPAAINQPIVKSRMILPQTQPRPDSLKTSDGQSGPSGYRMPPRMPTGSTIRQVRIPIIMYHYIRINDPEDEKGVSLSVSPMHFAQQLDDLKQRGYQTITFQDLMSRNLPSKPIILTFDDGYEDFYTTAYPELARHQMTAVVYVIADFQKPEYLTPGQTLYLASRGIEIGSHTLDHASLDKTSAQETIRQLTGSRQLLEQMTGRPVVSIAYPFGSFDAEIERLAIQAGYQFGVTTVGGLADLAQPMELMRFRAKDIATLEFDDNIAKTNASSNSEIK